MTPQMRDTLEYIRNYMAANRIAPSHQEIADALGLASKSGVARRLRGLEDRGAIRRLNGQSRAIEIVQRFCPHCGGEL